MFSNVTWLSLSHLLLSTFFKKTLRLNFRLRLKLLCTYVTLCLYCRIFGFQRRVSHFKKLCQKCQLCICTSCIFFHVRSIVFLWGYTDLPDIYFFSKEIFVFFLLYDQSTARLKRCNYSNVCERFLCQYTLAVHLTVVVGFCLFVLKKKSGFIKQLLKIGLKTLKSWYFDNYAVYFIRLISLCRPYVKRIHSSFWACVLWSAYTEGPASSLSSFTHGSVFHSTVHCL